MTIRDSSSRADDLATQRPFWVNRYRRDPAAKLAMSGMPPKRKWVQSFSGFAISYRGTLPLPET
jgi:hypothetical protein